MSLYKDKEIDELYQLKHLHDNNKFSSYDIENNIIKRSVSNFLFSNNIMASFLEKVRKLVYMFFDNKNVIRNFKNWAVDKYYNNHVD